MVNARSWLGFSSNSLLLAAGAFIVSCSGTRLYYLDTELPMLEGRPRLRVGPGPWPEVPAVLSSLDSIPDDLVLSALRTLMALPGAADACDAWGRPRSDATEYCVAIYRTPDDWRVTWPIRKLIGAHSACVPPFGGVEDADFGQGLPVFGYAHNHTCGLFASSQDLKNFPTAKLSSGGWVFVGYGITPSGDLALDSRGQQIPAWGWLATGYRDAPRFYKWNPEGKVFKWNEDKKQWEVQAICQPQEPQQFQHSQQSNSDPLSVALPPKCSPELVDWY
jgi:hypothetical protein